MGARLVIATTNSAKLAEYRLLLAPYSLELVSLRDVGIDREPAETGATFRENALLKARFYYDLTRLRPWLTTAVWKLTRCTARQA